MTITTLKERDLMHERVLGVMFNISPAQAAVLSCLLRSTVVTGSELEEHCGCTYAKVVVSRTRSRLKEKGYDIKSKHLTGYWIEADDKAAIEAAVKEFVEE